MQKIKIFESQIIEAFQSKKIKWPKQNRVMTSAMVA